MRLDRSDRRMSYVFLCAAPFFAIIAAGVRPPQAQGVHHVIGAVLFTAICVTAWILGARALRSNAQGRRQLGLTGALLVAPFAIIALMWVGLGPPWEATAAENQMRYLALIVMSSAVAIGFVVLKDAPSEAGERFYSTLAFAAIILAGPFVSHLQYICIRNECRYGANWTDTSDDRFAECSGGHTSIPRCRSDLLRHGSDCGFPQTN